MSTVYRSVRTLLCAVCVSALAVVGTQAQTKPAPPKPAPKPAAPRPQTQKPATAKPAPEPAKPTPPPSPQDVRYKTVYTNGDQKTESVTYVKGERERFEFQDMILLKQRDQKRTVQISRSANAYLVTPEDSPAVPPPAQPSASTPAPTPGVATVVTTIVDTGERKMLFGQQARHVKTLIDRQGAPKGCDPTKQRLETDGWYIDLPKSLASAPATDAPATSATCVDQVSATVNGDPAVLGFPVAYTTTVTGPDGKPSVTSMEVSEFELTTLDPSLFEVPQGMTAVLSLKDLSKALSDSSEARLVAANDAPPPAAPPAPAPGNAPRVAVVEPTNKTDQQVDTRTLRARIISGLTAQKLDAAPLTGRSPAELQKRAAERGFDYVLLTELTELKTSKGGVLSRIPGAGTGSKPSTEATLSVRLLQAADGKARLTSTAKGKEGGFNWKGTLQLAGTAYMTMFLNPAMLLRMNNLGVAGMAGMGAAGSPTVQQLQLAGLGRTKRGGLDATAGAASLIMERAMAMDDAAVVATAEGGASLDEPLAEAVNKLGTDVLKAVQRK